MGIAYKTNIVRDGLTLYLDAANIKSYSGSGTVWNDLSKTKVNASLVNGPTYNTSNLGSILFDNVNDIATVTHSSSHLSTSGTIIFWAKPLSDGTSNVCRLINKSNDSVGTGGYNVAMNNNTLLLRVNAGTLAGTLDLSNYYSKWSQYTFSWNSANKGSIYINDVLDVSGALGATVTMTTTNPLYIGNIADLTRTFDGNISIVQYYNRQLSFTEIQQNFNAVRGRYNV